MKLARLSSYRSLSRRPQVPESGGLRRRIAFTLLELLVVIAVIAILAAILLPALNRAKQKAQGVYCMNNGKQLFLGLYMYAEDNAEWLPPNETGDLGTPYFPAWVMGDIRTADATNTSFLTDPKSARLAPYTGRQARLYKCPADKRMWTDSGGASWPRVRTYAMNMAVGTLAYEQSPTDGWDLNWSAQSRPGSRNHHNQPWRTYGKFKDMVAPIPSSLFIFIDNESVSLGLSEYDPGYINTAAFWRPMYQSPTVMESWPGNYHNLGCMLTYADGHAELHRWKDNRTYAYTVTQSFGNTGGLIYQTQPDNQDIIWLQERTSAAYQP